MVCWARLGSALAGLLAGAAFAADASPRSRDEAARLARSLEGMANRGEIAMSDLDRLREDLFERWPEARDALPHPVLCQTEAVHRARAFAGARGVVPLRIPPPHSNWIDSLRYPIRVHHPNDLFRAQAILAAAEDAWRVQIDAVGYPAPHTDGDEGPVIPGIWYYLADAGGAAAYAEWLADIPGTTRCDCSCRIVVDPSVGLADLPIIVAHEFSHATQIATDCTEAISAFENFATAVMTQSYPASSLPLGLIASFQSHPEWPVDAWGLPSSEYQYGAALFPLYLDARFGSNDMTFLRDVWNGFAQSGSVTVSSFEYPTCSSGNSPDWFEALDSLLRQRAGSSFDEAFDEFSTWRAITGAHDDGAHYPRGTDYPAAAVADLSLATLPASTQRAVHDYGSVHVLLTNRPQEPVDVRITTDEAATFGASLILWRDNGTVDRVQAVFDGDTAVVPVASFDVTRALVVVSQRSAGDYDPDRMQYTGTRLVEVSVGPAVGPSPPDAGVVVDFDAWPTHDVVLPSAGPGESSGLNPAPRGCACRLGAGEPSSPWWWLLAITLTLRGRRDRAICSP